MNQKTSKVEKEFYLRCSYLTLSVLFDKEPKILDISVFSFNASYRDRTYDLRVTSALLYQLS